MKYQSIELQELFAIGGFQNRINKCVDYFIFFVICDTSVCK
jgi:hypothetical protein